MADTEVFQRLRKIRQLAGAHLVYPSAQHTRFEHSLGVMHLAGLAAETLLDKGYITYKEDVESLRIAALLHDIGHLLHDLPTDASEKGIDDLHEDLAAIYLQKYFKPAVVEAVKLHVAAKRYLCAVEQGYFESLSKASKISLQFQGGIMNPDEVSKFELNEFYKEAISLRRWDDEAKVANLVSPFLESFIASIESSLK